MLQAAAGGREVEPDAPLAIGHHDLAASGDVPRGIELSAEQTPNLRQQPVPWRRVLIVHLQAEVAQHLGGAAFADADVDGTAVETRLRGGQPRHRRQEGDAGIPGLLGDRHPVGCLTAGHSQRPAVEGLLVRVVELQSTRPAAVVGHPLHDEIDADVAGLGTSLDLAHVSHVQIAPQEVGVRNGDCHEITPIDGHAGPLLGRAPTRPLLVPALETDIPERERLHGGSLAGVVGADEHHRTADLDLDLSKAFEIPE